MDLIFFFPRPFILTYRHVFFPSLSPLLQRGRSKATLCSFRKAACSTTFTIRRNAGNLTGKQTDEKEKTRQRESIDLHVRHSVTLSIVGAWFTGVPGSMSCAILSGKSRYLWVNEFSWTFLNFSFFFNLFATILILSSVDVDIDISQMMKIISMMKIFGNFCDLPVTRR